MAPIIAPGPAIAASVPGGPLDLEATVNEDPAVANAAIGGPITTVPQPTEPATSASGTSSMSSVTRVKRPDMPDGPRRIGIQIGHWEAEIAPPELGARIRTQTGTSWGNVNERDINRDIALRVKGILEPQGYAVDVLPVTLPTGYLADAFVSLHGDGDGTGQNSGFKMAYSTRRTPYEAQLLAAIKETYGAATGLRYDSERVTRNMTGYYAHNWRRYQNATSPFTPSVILEMGYVSHAGDRALMTRQPDVIATAIASGIVSFLEAHPREALFGKDLLVQQSRFRPQAP
jgi:N-acetylmuramoyl-L-alanine amidase